MSPAEIVQHFIDQINVHDVDGLSVLLTPDHRFIDSLGSVVVGRETMREGWRQYFQMVPDYHIEITQAFTDGGEVALLGSAGGTYARNMQMKPADAWQTPAAWHAVVRDGLIAEWQVYADNEPIRQRMRQPA